MYFMKIKVSEKEKKDLIKIKDLISSEQLEVRMMGKELLKKYKRFYKYIWFIVYEKDEYKLKDHTDIFTSIDKYYIEYFSISLNTLDNRWSRGELLCAFIDAVISGRDVFYQK